MKAKCTELVPGVSHKPQLLSISLEGFLTYESVLLLLSPPKE